MSMLPDLALEIRQGANVDLPLRIETDILVFAAISGMTRAAPLRVTATAHGLPDGWRAAIVGAVGMSELNAPWDGVREQDLRRISRVDADTVDFPGVSARGFRAYTAGGDLVYYRPLDLSLYASAAMQVREPVSGALVAEWTSAAATLEIDATNAAIWLRLSAAQASAIAAGSYRFDVELTRVSGGIDALCSAVSTLSVLPEITTV